MRMIVLLLALLLQNGASLAQDFTADQQDLIDEHVFGGLPSSDNILVRNAYVMSYNNERRVANWVAYRVVPDYRKTPDRSGPFDDFVEDPDVDDAVSSSDYTGYFRSRGYARGHMVPYAVLGGDRDGDGKFATDDDPEDELTVFQGNYMSNVAPQHHYGFNGSGGIWYKAERWLQDDLIDDQQRTIWEIAGTIFGPQKLEEIGPDNSIEVPPLFFKIMVSTEDGSGIPEVLAFLFPHHRKAHGELEDYLVSVDIIESLTGLDFFKELDDDIESGIEDRDTFENWSSF